VSTTKLRMIAALAAVVIAALCLAGCGSAEKSAAPTALPMTVSVSQAAALRDGGAYVLDVREPSEFAAGHIAGATLIPLGELASRTAEVPHDKTVVVVCHSGNRSAQGRGLLRQAGFTNVTSMAGGMIDWSAAGLPVTTDS
jgi:rhodanese-related sulfurtransferase